MISEVTSNFFYQAWITVVEEKRLELLDKWNNFKEYTDLIVHSNNSVLISIAELLEIKCYNKDYYSVDAVFYCDEDRVPQTKFDSWWFRGLRVAFEHENNFNSGLFQEVSHLLIIDCELRVLVSYPNRRRNDELKYLHEVINGSRNSEDLSAKENFLIIFGYEDLLRWEGLVFKKDGWKVI